MKATEITPEIRQEAARTASALLAEHAKNYVYIDDEEDRLSMLCSIMNDNKSIIDLSINEGFKNGILFKWLVLTDLMRKIFYKKDFENDEIPVFKAESNAKNQIRPNVHLNKDTQSIWMSDMTRIDFFNLYPSIICQLMKDRSSKFNIEYFEKLFPEVIIIYNSFKHLRFIIGKGVSRNEYDFIRTNLKAWLNMTYGILETPMLQEIDRFLLDTSLKEEVLNKAGSIMNEMVFHFKSNIVYSDIDQIFFVDFDKIEAKFRFQMNNHPYLVYDVNLCSGIFLGARKYIVKNQDNINVEVVGFKNNKNPIQYLDENQTKVSFTLDAYMISIISTLHTSYETLRKKTDPSLKNTSLIVSSESVSIENHEGKTITTISRDELLEIAGFEVHRGMDGDTFVSNQPKAVHNLTNHFLPFLEKSYN